MKIDNDLIKKQLLGFQKEVDKRCKTEYICTNSSSKYININEETIDLLGNHLHGISIRNKNRIIDFRFETLLDNRFLPFAQIENHVFCLDTQKLNCANQWNILEYHTKHLVTLTIGSFLLNKIWAWLDKGRTIWKDESYN